MFIFCCWCCYCCFICFFQRLFFIFRNEDALRSAKLAVSVAQDRIKHVQQSNQIDVRTVLFIFEKIDPLLADFILFFWCLLFAGGQLPGLE